MLMLYFLYSYIGRLRGGEHLLRDWRGLVPVKLEELLEYVNILILTNTNNNNNNLSNVNNNQNLNKLLS